MTPNESCDYQIRLPLPKQWVEELNTIAKSQFTTRLTIIRAFIRAKLDEEMQRLVAYQQSEEERQRAKQFTDAKLKQRDEWK